MANVIADRVKETTTTTGTGTISLGGAVAGFQAFATAFSSGVTVPYCIADTTNNDFEVGTGVYTSGSPGTLTRAVVLSSSNAGSLVSLAAGSKEVMVAFPAAWLPPGALLSTANTWTAAQTFTPPNASTVPVVVKGFASQSANLLNITDSSSTILSYFDSSGRLAGPVGPIGNPTATLKNDLAVPNFAWFGSATLSTAVFFLNYANGNVGLCMSGNIPITWCSGAGGSSVPDTWIRRGSAATVHFGNADNSTPVAQTLQVQSPVAGTSNTAGTNWTLKGSKGTGTAAGGQIILQTAPAGATGTSQNTLVPAITLTAPAQRGGVTQQPSVVLGNAAIATADTDGFLYIPTCAGTPTGVPTTFTGRVALVYDTTNHQFWIYDGGWLQPKTPAGAALVTWQ